MWCVFSPREVFCWYSLDDVKKGNIGIASRMVHFDSCTCDCGFVVLE